MRIAVGLLFVIVVVSADVADAAITAFPRSTVARSNSTVVFDCVTDTLSTVLRWFHYEAMDSKLTILVSGNRVRKSYQPRFTLSVNKTEGHSRLTIQPVLLKDAALYGCQEQQDATSVTYFSLVVIASGPTCRNRGLPANNVVDEYQSLSVDCIVSYSGNWTPSFTCRDVKRETELQVTSDSVIAGDVTVTHMLNVTRAMHGTTVHCHMVRDNTTDLALDYIWTSPVILVAYEPTSATIIPTNASLSEHGALMSCASDGYPSPTIEWTELGTGLVVHSGTNYTVDICTLRQRLGRLDDDRFTVTLLCRAKAGNRTVSSSNNVTLTIQGNDTASCRQHTTDGGYWWLFIVVGCGFASLSAVGISLLIICSPNYGTVCPTEDRPDIVREIRDLNDSNTAAVNPPSTSRPTDVEQADDNLTDDSTAGFANQATQDTDCYYGPQYAQLAAVRPNGVSVNAPARSMHSAAVYAEIDHASLRSKR